MKFYRHQYFAIIALTVISIIKLILLHTQKEDNDEKVGKEMNIVGHFIFDIVYSFFKSLMTVYIKG